MVYPSIHLNSTLKSWSSQGQVAVNPLADRKYRAGVMESLSFGVMGENRTEEYKPCFGEYRVMTICSVKVIG